MKILGNLNWEQEKERQKKIIESIRKRWEKNGFSCDSVNEVKEESFFKRFFGVDDEE